MNNHGARLLRQSLWLGVLILLRWPRAFAAEPVLADPHQVLERTCFQTGAAYSDIANLRSDVAIVYGIDAGLPARVQTWRERGYRIHVMTGVAWGNYQDYLYGRFDGVNHEDEAQTDRQGKKISHGGDVYYMSPGENYGKFLCVGVQRALDAGAEAIHLEEPEFWVRGGYSEGFKREWKKFYGEDWVPPHASVEAQWRASKLKYYLYRRALQQVFDYVQEYNRRSGRQVRCYVPTHSLLNYAHWRIVSPESSLSRLNGCDGYIAQVWTGTSRTPNRYRGQRRERTFETAFLEYGAMQNLVRSTGRRVWYLNDPVEDDPNHDWTDYAGNWESTLVASLFQPGVWRYEVAPWPERVFGGRYPKRGQPAEREPMPAAYATEVQTVINALNDMDQEPVRWDCGAERVGVLVSDSLMFQRGEPRASDPDLSHIYGLALPLLKHGCAVTPVQLENTPLPGYLDALDLILMTYEGMKPLSAEVHGALARWVRSGGVLLCWDDDQDPYHQVREWWNSGDQHYRTPRLHLFEQLGLTQESAPGVHRVGRGVVVWRAEKPSALAADPAGDAKVIDLVRLAARGSRLNWRETNYLLLRRGKYLVAAGLDESSPAPSKVLGGQFVNLFDPGLELRESITLSPASRYFLLDVAKIKGRQPQVLLSACKALPGEPVRGGFRCQVEGVVGTTAVMLFRVPSEPSLVMLAGDKLEVSRYDDRHRLLWLRFPNEPRPRMLELKFR